LKGIPIQKYREELEERRRELESSNNKLKELQSAHDKSIHENSQIQAELEAKSALVCKLSIESISPFSSWTTRPPIL
jgi:hypothetical protein